MSRYVLFACLGAALMPGGRAVHADAVLLLIDTTFGSTENTGSRATVTLDFSEDGLDDLLAVTLENTTPAEIGSSLTAVGLELPDSLSLAVSFAPGGEGSYFDTLTFDDSISPGWLDAPVGYDVMLTSDGHFEGGGSAGAPTEGESETVVLTLGDTGWSPSELAAAFAGYYADLTGDYVVGRFHAVGPDGEDSDKVGGRVPEPGSLVLLGLGALGLLHRKGRRRSGLPAD